MKMLQKWSNGSGKNYEITMMQGVLINQYVKCLLCNRVRVFVYICL